MWTIDMCKFPKNISLSHSISISFFSFLPSKCSLKRCSQITRKKRGRSDKLGYMNRRGRRVICGKRNWKRREYIYYFICGVNLGKSWQRLKHTDLCQIGEERSSSFFIMENRRSWMKFVFIFLSWERKDGTEHKC